MTALCTARKAAHTIGSAPFSSLPPSLPPSLSLAISFNRLPLCIILPLAFILTLCLSAQPRPRSVPSLREALPPSLSHSVSLSFSLALAAQSRSSGLVQKRGSERTTDDRPTPRFRCPPIRTQRRWKIPCRFKSVDLPAGRFDCALVGLAAAVARTARPGPIAARKRRRDSRPRRRTLVPGRAARAEASQQPVPQAAAGPRRRICGAAAGAESRRAVVGSVGGRGGGGGGGGGEREWRNAVEKAAVAVARRRRGPSVTVAERREPAGAADTGRRRWGGPGVGRQRPACFRARRRRCGGAVEVRWQCKISRADPSR